VKPRNSRIKARQGSAANDPAGRKEEKAYSVECIRRAHPNAYREWTSDDDDELRRAFERGGSVRDLSELFGRQPGAIRSRLRKLGFLR